MSSVKRDKGMSAIELISLVGFSMLMAWMFIMFFWLFRDFPAGVPLAARDLTQLAVFIGIPAGYLILFGLGKIPRFNLFSTAVMGVELVCSLLLPIVAFAMYHFVYIPLAVVVIANALGGLACACLTVSWLDVLSRLKTRRYGRFTGFAFAIGALFFLFAVLMPDDMQPIFGFVYILFSICMLVYSTQNADGNDEAAPLESTESTWKFTKEIEPSFFVFGMVFALNFVFMFNNGQETLLAGLVSVIPGALLIAALEIANKHVSITMVQRVLLVVTVLSCVLMPFAQGVIQIGCVCLVVASWAAFRSINYAFVVQKCTLGRFAPLFRQAPMRLWIPSLGFALGWAVASIVTLMYGPHSEPFTVIRLAMAFILVVVVMVFYPIGRHHLSDGTAEEERNSDDSLYSVQMNESELFDRRCAEIVKLYQLSPREADILVFLAKGRNAAWIQEQLTISPHTVKSHIYNIYRKLDIHSQQKLMSFVEEFPLDI